MLTKKDLTRVEEIVDVALKNRFEEFYFSIFEPHVTASEKAHEDIRQDIKQMRLEIKSDLKEAVSGIGEYIKDHEKRIRKLEIKTGL